MSLCWQNTSATLMLASPICSTGPASLLAVVAGFSKHRRTIDDAQKVARFIAHVYERNGDRTGDGVLFKFQEGKNARAVQIGKASQVHRQTGGSVFRHQGLETSLDRQRGWRGRGCLKPDSTMSSPSSTLQET